jgi:transcription elongation factor Elf1
MWLMEAGLEDSVACFACGYELAKVVTTREGIRELNVYCQIKLTIVDKENNIGLVWCPICGAKTQTNLGFWRQF